MSVYERAATWASGVRDSKLPDAVEHHAKRAVVDWFAAVMPGSAMQPAKILEAALATQDERGDARLQPSGRSVPIRTAALINGTAAHSAEVDDIFREGIYHPGAPTIAAALATCQHLHRGGAEFLRAVHVGFEISTRIAARIQPSHYEFWHTTGTVGTIGAAAAVASALRLTTEPFVHALATATTMAAGLQQAFRSDAMSKPLHAGHAAEAGALAGLAAAHGFTGATDILEGEAGFVAGMSEVRDLDGLFDDLDDRSAITEMTFKAHACCGHTFAAIDAALEMRNQVDPARVTRIVVATYQTAIKVAGNPAPSTEFEARFSIQYCVAAALVLGSVWLEAFGDEYLHDETLGRLVRQTELVVEPELDAAFPGRRGARVTVELDDGSVHEVLRQTRKGDPDAPLSDDELAAKLSKLGGPVVGDRAVQDLTATLWTVTRLEDVHTLVPSHVEAPT